jgi:tetratricopeptide (TPR) repeat protein
MRRVLLLLPLLCAEPATAQTIDNESRYRECMALVERSPDAGFEAALAWQGLGGGNGAMHCLAKALFWLKQYGEAARRFERLAQEMPASPEFKADLLAQAAQAWLLAGDAARAEDLLTAALGLAPDDADLFIDRSRARADQRRYRDAVDDLDRAIQIDPYRPDAFAYRASAHRHLDALDAAEADADRALWLDPANPYALLERGTLRRLRGDADGARADWMAVLRAAPDTPVAEDARTNIERMDVRIEGK